MEMRRNTSDAFSERSQEPSSSVKTLPVSTHAAPHLRRSLYCRTRWARRTATTPLERAIVPALPSVLGSDS